MNMPGSVYAAVAGVLVAMFAIFFAFTATDRRKIEWYPPRDQINHVRPN